MRPGRLPDDHPEEKAARARLRGLSPQALEKLRREEDRVQTQVVQLAPRRGGAAPARWEPGR